MHRYRLFRRCLTCGSVVGVTSLAAQDSRLVSAVLWAGPSGNGIRRAAAYAELIAPGYTPIADALVAAARPRQKDDVLELGAGTGLVTRRVSRHVRSLVATDLAPEMLYLARRSIRRTRPRGSVAATRQRASWRAHAARVHKRIAPTIGHWLATVSASPLRGPALSETRTCGRVIVRKQLADPGRGCGRPAHDCSDAPRSRTAARAVGDELALLMSAAQYCARIGSRKVHHVRRR